MKKTILFASLASFTFFSCAEKSTTHQGHEETHATSEESSATAVSVTNTKSTTAIIDSYLAVKDALVADDQTSAAEKSKELTTALNGLDIANSGNPEELGRLQNEAISASEKLASGDIAVQRENFQALSVTLKDLLKIAGTDRTLYHQHCPMYKNNTGGMWLSASKDIKNPLFGSSMLTCGRVEETINS
ncbi:MAG TPA: DUF3347 domain-containing protein [Algoriphagus sp.]|nr:DUF3347 domain-containing protein [Algoriphagus sp.]